MRTSGKVGIAVAAAFGALYGAYALGSKSQDNSQAKHLEEAVCEEVDTQAIYDKGRNEGYLAGLRAGRREGEVIGERETKDKWFESGKQYGLEACGNKRYNEGLEACDDSKYAEGKIEGEKMGLEEGRRKFLGSGTFFLETEKEFIFRNIRNITGEYYDYYVTIDRQSRCIRRRLAFHETEYSTQVTLYYLISDACNNDITNLQVDYIQRIISTNNSGRNSFYRADYLLREEDMSANQNLFLWADQKLQEQIEGFSSMLPTTFFVNE